MEKQIDKKIKHILDLERKLEQADNNLRYVKALYALKKALDNLKKILREDSELLRKYSSIHRYYFYYKRNDISRYDRLCISIIVYMNGNRPF